MKASATWQLCGAVRAGLYINSTTAFVIDNSATAFVIFPFISSEISHIHGMWIPCTPPCAVVCCAHPSARSGPPMARHGRRPPSVAVVRLVAGESPLCLSSCARTHDGEGRQRKK
jgi:hypothetical protein